MVLLLLECEAFPAERGVASQANEWAISMGKKGQKYEINSLVKHTSAGWHHHWRCTAFQEVQVPIKSWDLWH